MGVGLTEWRDMGNDPRVVDQCGTLKRVGGLSLKPSFQRQTGCGAIGQVMGPLLKVRARLLGLVS